MNASGGGTDAERVVLLLVEWEEQEGEKQHKRKRVRIEAFPRTSYTSPSGACSQCFRRS